MLERGRLLSLVDQLLFYEQDRDREQQHAYQACMGSLSFPALARLVSPTHLCFQVQPRLVGQVRRQGEQGCWQAARRHMICWHASCLCPSLSQDT